MSVAFFDFDKTLIDRNSARLWLRHELARGGVPWLQAARALLWLGQYRLGRAGLEGGILTAIESLRGRGEDALREEVYGFYREEVRRYYRPRALEQVRLHQSRGDAVVLLTSASLYLSEAVRDDLGLDDIICNRFEVADGQFTGRPEGELCYGQGKRVLGLAWLGARGEKAEVASFYTDSMTDAPFMEVVGHPVAVNPDARLRRLATRRGWPIEDWRGLSGARYQADRG